MAYYEHLRQFNFQRAAAIHQLMPPPPPPPLWGSAGGGVFATSNGFVLVRPPYMPSLPYYVSNNYQFQDQSNNYNSITRSTYYVQESNMNGNLLQLQDDQTLILEGRSSIPRRQQYARNRGPRAAHIRRRDHNNNICNSLEDQITKCLKIIKKNLCTSSAGDKEKEEEESDEVCAICLDELCPLENNDDGTYSNLVASLDCKHEYHSDCIRKWLRLKNFCPLCKSVAY